MKKLYFILSFVAVAQLSYGQIIFNEVLYDPSNVGLDGDANRDSIYSQDDDSFVEIYNTGSSPFDISGYEIWDDTASGTLQYTFPANTSIPVGEVILVFGGGNPTGTFGSAQVLNAMNGFNFNNSGEVIGVKDTSGNWAITFDSDALSNNPNSSYTRIPDVTGGFVQSEDTSAFFQTPGAKVDLTPFRTTIGLKEYDNSIQLNIYPNPVGDQLNISSDVKFEIIEVFNVNGAKMLEYRNATNQIDVSNLPNGIYMLRVSNDDEFNTLRFIKE